MDYIIKRDKGKAIIPKTKKKSWTNFINDFISTQIQNRHETKLAT